MTKVPQTVSDATDAEATDLKEEEEDLLIILISTLNSTSVPFSDPTDEEFRNLNKRQ